MIQDFLNMDTPDRVKVRNNKKRDQDLYSIFGLKKNQMENLNNVNNINNINNLKSERENTVIKNKDENNKEANIKTINKNEKNMKVFFDDSTKNINKKNSIKLKDVFEVFEKTKENKHEIKVRDKTPEARKSKRINEQTNNNNLIKFNSNTYKENVYLQYDTNKLVECLFILHKYHFKLILDDRIQSQFYNKIRYTSSFFEFPKFYVDKLKYNKDTHQTLIKLKDHRCFYVTTKKEDFFNILNFHCFPKDNIDFYDYAFFYKKLKEKEKYIYKIEGWDIYNPIQEFLRQGVDFSVDGFRLSEINKGYNFCTSYPSFLVLPAQCDEEGLEKAKTYRMKNRLPALTYFYHRGINNKTTGCLFRSAQIKKKIIIKSKNNEIDYINLLTGLSNTKKEFYIFDCRPNLNAKANSLKGGGIEDISDYSKCKDIFFGNIENIHEVRKSLKNIFEKVRYGNQQIEEGKIRFNDGIDFKGFYSKIDDSKWLNYLSDIIKFSYSIAKCIYDGYNVLCHCSDGWDRTSQCCSLAQIILDPYYRTLKGFAVLVEKDWVSFGHQFSLRNGCSISEDKKSERSPIFIQFLHCVFQFLVQFPTAFEFNENLLLFLCDNLYSNKYGTFLFNSEEELNVYDAKKKTISIWSDIFEEKENYINYFYKESNDILKIKHEIQFMSFWRDYFYKYEQVGLLKYGEIRVDKLTNFSDIIQERNKDLKQIFDLIKENNLEGNLENNKLFQLYNKNNI